MGTSPGLIDLGVYSYRAGPEQAPEAPVPVWARLRRWVPVALVMALVWPLAGAAAAPVRPLVPLWTAPDGPGGSGTVAVGDTDLYAVTATAGGPALTAYRLADGSVRWEVPVAIPTGPDGPLSPRDVGVMLVDGMVVVHTYRRPEFTAVFDPGTAQLRWTGEGYPGSFGAGLVALYASPGDGLDTTMEIRELGTGAVQMSVEGSTQQFAHQASPDGTVQLVGLDRDGSLTSYDATTGAVLRRVKTPHEEWLRASSQNRISIVDDLVLVEDNTGARPELAAYDLAGLAPLWTFPGGSSAYSCGPVVCIQTATPDGRPTGLHGLDPVTGASRWSTSCTDSDAAQCFLGVRKLGPGGRLLVESRLLDEGAGWAVSGLWVTDAATGQRLTESAGWRFEAREDAGLLLSRGNGVILWARADRSLERIEVLGAMDADRCTPHEPYLVCRTDGEPFEVWRVRS